MEGPVRIGINGFGRIGRNLFRLLLDNPDIEVVGVNDPAPLATMAHLLKYDSIHGVLHKQIGTKDNFLLVDHKPFRFMQYAEPSQIPWSALEVDLVVECSGKFKTRNTLRGHLQRGAKQVVLSVPPDEETIPMVVLGVNEQLLNGSEDIISNASCTTNNAAPMLQVVHELCQVQSAYITTVHSYTTDQSLHDQPHRDLRRARAAGQSIVPTTTGAAKALTKVFPDLSEVIGGCGIRVPVPNGSLTDMTLQVNSKTSIEQINTAFEQAAQGRLKHILQYTTDPIVSVDIVGNTHSCIFDAQMTSVVGGHLVKIIGWYDNEIGYSSRLKDLISLIYNK